MKTSGKTFKHHYSSELVFQSSWEIAFSFPLHLNSVPFTVIFSHRMTSLTYEKKPPVTVDLLLWLYLLFILFGLNSILTWGKKKRNYLWISINIHINVNTYFSAWNWKTQCDCDLLTLLNFDLLDFLLSNFFLLLWTLLQLQPSCNHFQIFILGK